MAAPSIARKIGFRAALISLSSRFRMSRNTLSTFLGAFIFSVVGIIGLQARLYGAKGRVLLLISTVWLVVPWP